MRQSVLTQILTPEAKDRCKLQMYNSNKDKVS